MDDEIAIRALEWMAKPNARGVAGPDVDYQGSVAYFSNRSAAFALNGEWEVTTYQAMDLPFGMTTVPTIFDQPANQADSHTFVIPRDPNRPRERLEATLAFISRLVSKGLDWAKGGHVPAYREIFDSDEYRKLTPQSDYADAAERLVFDPLAWYSGSGSNLEYNAGAGAEARARRHAAARAGPADLPRLPRPHAQDPEARLMATRRTALTSRPAARTRRRGPATRAAAAWRCRSPRRSSSSSCCSCVAGAERAATSLFDDSLVGGASWAGLENYRELLGDPNFWAAMWHTALFTLLSVPPLVLLPLGWRCSSAGSAACSGCSGWRSSRPTCCPSRSSCWSGTGSTSRASG